MVSTCPVNKRSCPNPDCTFYRQKGRGNTVKHSFFRLKRGKRRRYRCKTCGKTFSSSVGTPYYRLKHTRRAFDEIAAMSVEGVSISSIARIKGLSWNTVARWIERAADATRRFNHVMTRGCDLKELQADEIRTFLVQKDRPTWIFSAVEVWSRLWASTVVGRRSYWNTRRVIRDTVHRARLERPPLITTDGFQYYHAVIHRLFGHACVYGQVMKTWRNNRVIKVERHLAIGTRPQLKEALCRSEDSSSLNTSFIERLNLTIRQGSAYLGRRTPGHARWREHLDDHLELLRCHYNFIRPHGALKAGREARTRAMQAGLVSRRLSFREIFMAVAGMVFCVIVVLDFRARWSTFNSAKIAA